MYYTKKNNSPYEQSSLHNTWVFDILFSIIIIDPYEHIQTEQHLTRHKGKIDSNV